MSKLKAGRWEYSEEELNAMIDEATAQGKAVLESEPRAESAHYDRRRKRIVVNLTNDCTFMFPPELVQGLRGASAEDLAAVRILPGGFALGWDNLDVHLGLKGLLSGEFGSRKPRDEHKRRVVPLRQPKQTSATSSTGKVTMRDYDAKIERRLREAEAHGMRRDEALAIMLRIGSEYLEAFGYIDPQVEDEATIDKCS